MAFMKQFAGIGEKYARDMLMDAYHDDFHDSVALDSRVKSIRDDVTRANRIGKTAFVAATFVSRRDSLSALLEARLQ